MAPALVGFRSSTARRSPAPPALPRLLLLIGVACGWCLPLSAARAEPARVYFDWQRPLASTCPPEKILEADVEEALDRSVFTLDENAPLHIQGRIDESASGTRVRLIARRRDGVVLGTRTLQAKGAKCAALRSDIVLVLILLVERESAPSKRSDWSWRVGLSASALGYVLPRWSPGIGADLILSLHDRLQLRADLSVFLPMTIQTSRGIRADVSSASFGLSACPRLLGGELSRWSLLACGGARLLGMLVSQTAPTTPASEPRLSVQGFLDVRGALRVGQRAQLELAAGPLLSFLRASIYARYGASTELLLYRPPLLGLQVQLALVL